MTFDFSGKNVFQPGGKTPTLSYFLQDASSTNGCTSVSRIYLTLGQFRKEWPVESNIIWLCNLGRDHCSVFGAKSFRANIAHLPSRVAAQRGSDSVRQVIRAVTNCGFESHIQVEFDGYWLVIRKPESITTRLNSLFYGLLPDHIGKTEAPITVKPQCLDDYIRSIAAEIYYLLTGHAFHQTDLLKRKLADWNDRLSSLAESCPDSSQYLTVERSCGNIEAALAQLQTAS